MTGEGLVNAGLWWFGRITEENLKVVSTFR
jgi:hypothetical protein